MFNSLFILYARAQAYEARLAKYVGNQTVRMNLALKQRNRELLGKRLVWFIGILYWILSSPILVLLVVSLLILTLFIRYVIPCAYIVFVSAQGMSILTNTINDNMLWLEEFYTVSFYKNLFGLNPDMAILVVGALSGLLLAGIYTSLTIGIAIYYYKALNQE